MIMFTKIVKKIRLLNKSQAKRQAWIDEWKSATPEDKVKREAKIK